MSWRVKLYWWLMFLENNLDSNVGMELGNHMSNISYRITYLLRSTRGICNQNSNPSGGPVGNLVPENQEYPTLSMTQKALNLWILYTYQAKKSKIASKACKTPSVSSSFNMASRNTWVFPKTGVGPQNGWWKSWKTLLKWDDLGGQPHYFRKHPYINGEQKPTQTQEFRE